MDLEKETLDQAIAKLNAICSNKCKECNSVDSIQYLPFECQVLSFDRQGIRLDIGHKCKVDFLPTITRVCNVCGNTTFHSTAILLGEKTV